MSNPDGSMTEAEYAAYQAKRVREWREHAALDRRYKRVCSLLESTFNSLTQWRRFVEQAEALLGQFRAEEQVLPPFAGSAFMRELCAEDPILWADLLAIVIGKDEA
jgi:hypothetical protein